MKILAHIGHRNKNYFVRTMNGYGRKGRNLCVKRLHGNIKEVHTDERTGYNSVT